MSNSKGAGTRKGALHFEHLSHPKVAGMSKGALNINIVHLSNPEEAGASKGTLNIVNLS